jgi:hypothetical protein
MLINYLIINNQIIKHHGYNQDKIYNNNKIKGKIISSIINKML